MGVGIGSWGAEEDLWQGPLRYCPTTNQCKSDICLPTGSGKSAIRQEIYCTNFPTKSIFKSAVYRYEVEYITQRSLTTSIYCSCRVYTSIWPCQYSHDHPVWASRPQLIGDQPSSSSTRLPVVIKAPWPSTRAYHLELRLRVSCFLLVWELP